MGPSGLEPPTSRLSGVRSNHLSYEPLFSWFLVHLVLFAFLTVRYASLRYPQSVYPA